MKKMAFNCCRADEFDKDLLDDTRWTEEFQTQTEAQVNLEKTANELLSSVADTKFSSSEVSCCFSFSFMNCLKILTKKFTCRPVN